MEEMIYNQVLEFLDKHNLDAVQKIIGDNDYIQKWQDKNGRTLLMQAIFRHNFPAAKIFIDSGSDVSLKDRNQCSALYYAVVEQQVDIVKYLVAKGANVNDCDRYGNSIFNKAVFYSKGRGEIIEILKTYKADPFVKNNYGIDAITLAISIANYNVLQYLQDYL